MDDATKRANDAILERIQGIPAKRLSTLEYLKAITDPNSGYPLQDPQANDNDNGATMNTCPHCGTPMFMQPVAGNFAWVCPRRHDGQHPVVVTYTSDSTSTPIPEALRKLSDS